MLKKLFTIQFILSTTLVFSQTGTTPSFYNTPMPGVSGENIELETDRYLYCINENIFFNANYHVIEALQGVSWSNVLYIELIKWNGEKIAQAKYKLTSSGTTGYLKIPKNVLSGNYYLRAYTNWMRNFSFDNYTYRLIKIVNPFEESIDNGTSITKGEAPMKIEKAPSKNFKTIDCSTDKNIYKQREKVELSFNLDELGVDASKICISVVKKGSIDTSRQQIIFPKSNVVNNDKLEYLPEIRGISISGKLIDHQTKEPLPDARINLSTPMNSQYCSVYITDAQGNFHFTIPELYGLYDFYIDAITPDGTVADFLIDNDYCNKKVQLDYIPFSLSDIEEETATQLAINMQLSSMYDIPAAIDKVDTNTYPFYGTPKLVYNTIEFIELPNVEEFIFEIVTEVHVLYKKRQPYLKLAEMNSMSFLDPLILLDNIPVENGSDFLKIPLKKIERVEVIPSLYITANKNYNGLIAIFTKNKDFAAINLNKNSMFFSYDMFSDGQFKTTNYASTEMERTTDKRNLLYWNPELNVENIDSENISFYTSDSKGEFLVYIREIGSVDKELIYGTCTFVVE